MSSRCLQRPVEAAAVDRRALRSRAGGEVGDDDCTRDDGRCASPEPPTLGDGRSLRRKICAQVQVRTRLGLHLRLVGNVPVATNEQRVTPTGSCEIDGREADVFSLIGPKRFDAPWKDIEAQGYIAPADCVEVRVTLPDAERMTYAMAEPEDRYRLASTSTSKNQIVEALVDKHAGEPTLVIGQYLDQLDVLAEQLNAELITGQTTVAVRQKLFQQFRTGEIGLLVVSKVANFSIDLPEATIAIQISGTFGSRQEEAQRLGRILRPKGDGRTAHFYSVVARDTVDADFAAHRQRFLAEQGYSYRIMDAGDLLMPPTPA